MNYCAGVVVVVIRGPFGDVKANAGGRSVAERNRPSPCFVAAAAASFGRENARPVILLA
jgi:hypothetical protein